MHMFIHLSENPQSQMIYYILRLTQMTSSYVLLTYLCFLMHTA